ncbi:MAG: hypothetical protein DIU78_020380 [Pseudomonadota bacterium]|nr:MAG: hypothetical protein DIU78_09775 [Pseudomonadota bacterium]
MRSCLLALACVTFPALARASGGEAMSSPAPAYSAWQGARHPGPPPAWFDRAPAPLPEQPEVPRRAFELVTEGAGAVPECRSSVALGCAGLAGGMELGLQALYRPTPSFAIGGTFRLDALSLQRAGASGEANASAWLAGVVARLDFVERGLFDPYAELALGVGSLRAVTHAPNGSVRDAVDVAAAARVAVGLDVALSSWVRVGPSLGYARFAHGTFTRCAGFECRTFSPEWASVPNALTSLGLRVTMAVGEAL